MSHVPSKRLFVYVALGVVVLVVGIWGVLSLRAGGAGVEVSLTGTQSSAGPGVSSGTAGTPAGAGPTTGQSGSSSGPAPQTSSTATTLRIWVQVAGAVTRPGVYQMDPAARVFQALEVAGGVTADADEDALPLASRLWDGCRLVVPRKGEAHGEVLTGQGSPATDSGQGSTSGSQGPAQKLSLNSATLDQLDALPGVGPATAQQIVAYRDANGPFTSVDQLGEVPGIGPAKLEKLRPLVEL
jgi:competence protein ComEA